MMIFSHNGLNALFKMVENMFLCLIKVSAIQINIVLENLYKCLIPLHLILTEQRWRVIGQQALKSGVSPGSCA